MVKLIVKNKSSLQKHMVINGYNLTDLSDELGITRQYLSLVISGNRNPSPSLAKSIANKLGVEISDIFFVNHGNKLFTSESV